ncbi:unnamed protein product [Mytilus coruscus]|uniref:Uncharacterized protein n=1 Tax=Mytilus coruscus TaxID=42192 RepID=A0A6J8DM99_MYTCO|nr:unnamed protein product [Mytilus coruscus]
MVMFENLDILESFSRVDKKTIETYVEEAELNRLSIIRLITTIEATIKYDHSKEIVRLCSALFTDTHILRRSRSFQSNTGQTCTSVMAIGDSHVCVTNMFIRQNYGNSGNINIFNMAGESKQVISHIIGSKFDIIGVNVRTCFLWNSYKIECIQMQTEEKFARTIDSWENDIQGLSPVGRACIMDNGNMLLLLKDKFYEVEETGKTVRTFTCNGISQIADFQPNAFYIPRQK